jgi:multiple sugar transport system permease protein
MLISFYSRDIFLIESAARSDGASRFQALYLVSIPLIAPGLIAAGLLGFILSWNEFIFVLILSGKATSTLPIGLSTLSTHRGVEIAQLAAATTLTILPALFLLPFIKKYLIKGLSLGALK